MLLLFFFAFLSGLVTILAPCIWPLLPIILSSASTQKGHQKPLGITLGIMISFAIFTLSVSTLVKLFHFDPNVLRLFAVVVIGFLGFMILIPSLNRFMEVGISKMTRLFGSARSQGNGFSAGFITGLSLGIVWSPCAGPILAAIATLAATGKVTSEVIFVTTAYVIGVGIPLFIFAYGGQKIVTSTRFLSKYTQRVQQVFAVFMILTAIAIYTNYDKVIQLKLLSLLPSYTNALTNLENNPTVQKQLNTLKGTTQHSTSNPNTNVFNANQQAPDFTGITKWLNSEKPLTISALKGKVVLVDFWTYTCINCIRTLPHVTSWYDTYHNKGFTVIGVHTPEFQFEHDTNNVLSAIKMYNIHYPVAQDNDYATWNAYNNQYWPAEYLIDTKGIIRRTHFGEGEYDIMENAIKALLEEAGQSVTVSAKQMPDETPNGNLSPETYIGSKRMEFYYPDGTIPSGSYHLSLSPAIQNTFSLGGEWNIEDEESVTGNGAVLTYNFVADKVFLVLRPPETGSGKVKVLIDGKNIDMRISGDDVKNGIITVNQDRLYNIVNLHGPIENHLLRLEFQTPGIQVFAFTFG